MISLRSLSGTLFCFGLFFFAGCGGNSRIVTADQLNATGTHIFSLAILSDGSLLAVGGQSSREKGSTSSTDLDGNTVETPTYQLFGFANFYDPNTNEKKDSQEYREDIISVATAPNLRLIALGSTDGKVRLYDASTKQIRWTQGLHTGQVKSLAFSPDGTTLASAGWDDKTLRLWRVSDGTSLGMVDVADGRAAAVAFSPDGRNIIVTAGRYAKIYDRATLSPVQTLRGGTTELFSLAYSPDGKFLALGGAGGAISVYNVPDYGLKESLTAHLDDILSLAFSPDSRNLLSGSRDTSALMWDVGTGTVRYSAHGLVLSAINAVVFTPDGSRFILGGDDGRVYFYETDTGRYLREIG